MRGCPMEGFMLAVMTPVPPVDKKTPSGAKLNWEGETVRVAEVVPYAVVNVILCAPSKVWEETVTVAVIWLSVAEMTLMAKEESPVTLPAVNRHAPVITTVVVTPVNTTLGVMLWIAGGSVEVVFTL